MLGGPEILELVKCAAEGIEFEKQGLVLVSCFTVLRNETILAKARDRDRRLPLEAR
jgi:hypothetical protein